MSTYSLTNHELRIERKEKTTFTDCLSKRTLFPPIFHLSSQSSETPEGLIQISFCRTEHVHAYRTCAHVQNMCTRLYTRVFMFCWQWIFKYACNETNLMHYLSSVCSFTTPLYVSGLFWSCFCTSLSTVRGPADSRTVVKHLTIVTYTLLLPDDELQASPKHVDVKCVSKVNIHSASSWCHYKHTQSLFMCVKGKGHPITGHQGPRGGVKI
jgi:hypothetical protein